MFAHWRLRVFDHREEGEEGEGEDRGLGSCGIYP